MVKQKNLKDTPAGSADDGLEVGEHSGEESESLESQVELFTNVHESAERPAFFAPLQLDCNKARRGNKGTTQ